jgi:hypothetical protein
VQADQARQEPRAAEVEGEPPSSEDLGEAGLVGGDDEVAAEGHVGAGPRRDAADLGDRGLGQAVQGQGDVADAAHRRQRVPGSLPAVDPAAGEVGAGAEGAAGAGDDHDAVVTDRDLTERSQELPPHQVVHRVLLLRAVQGDRDDAPVGPRDLDRLHASGPYSAGAMITAVGLNPYRQMRRRRSDYVFVAVALVVAAVLVLWAFFG